MYSTIIPAIKEQIPLKRNFEILSQTSELVSINKQQKQTNSNDVRRIDQIPEEEPGMQNNNQNSSFLTRSTSANSILKINSNQSIYYSKAIDYLKDQYKQTLDKLHQEVSELKAENQKLNFKLLVDNENSIEDIVNNSLSKPLKNMRLKSNTSIHNNGSASSSSIPQDILLNETIKDLKVKLKMSEDSNGHLNATIRNLTKKLNLLKRLGENAVSHTVENVSGRDRVISSGSSSRRSSLINQKGINTDEACNDLRLGIQKNTSPSSNKLPKNASVSLAVSKTKLQNQKKDCSKNQIKIENLHFPVPPSPKEKTGLMLGKTNLRQNNFKLRNHKTYSDRNSTFSSRKSSGNMMNEKDEVIDQLTQKNLLQKNRIDELESVLQQLQSKLAASEKFNQNLNLSGDSNLEIANDKNMVKHKDSNTTILRSAASKQTLQLLPPISNNRFHSFVGGNEMINYDESNIE